MRSYLIVGLSLTLSGCALGEHIKQIALSVGQTQHFVQDRHEQFSRITGNADTRRAAQDVDRPWLAGRAQPLAPEVSLPAALRANVNTTLMFAEGPMDLARLAQRITAVTHIPVHVRPDALLPLERFLPRLHQAGQTVG